MGKKLTAEEKKKRSATATTTAFRRKIRETFVNAGFEYLKTDDMHKKFGLKTGELDYVFLYKNILLVCEDTTTFSPDDIKTHLRKKKQTVDQISDNRPEFLTWLKTDFREKFDKFNAFSAARYKIFFLYFTRYDSGLTSNDIELYKPMKVIEYASLNYFHQTSRSIKKSSKYEIFRFLDLKTSEIDIPSSSKTENSITTPIIYPTDNTGLQNGVRLISFMMCADTLLRDSYVLRKDNWEDSIQLYQRLIGKDRIQTIRRFIADRGETFFNNIIVSLPHGVSFRDKDNNIIELDNISCYQNCSVVIPDEINSICIIDGQHRIYAHYEGDDKFEKKISKLRNQLHLLVTGLVFPQTMGELERSKFESQIFIDINLHSTPVPNDVLLHIRTLQDPYSDMGIARQVIAGLNKEKIFLNRFELSLLENSKIKIASIIKFALRYLVSMNPNPARPNLYDFWPGDKEALSAHDSTSLKDYIAFLVSSLKLYFGALKDAHKNDWENADSRILSVTSINGFIMAFHDTLAVYGVKDFAFYQKCFHNYDMDFSKDVFPYVSSRYRIFSKEILSNAFNLEEAPDGKWVIKN